MRIFVIAGEASGDAHGAEILTALQRRDPGIEVHGAGGPKMQVLAGADFLNWTGHAVIGVIDVIRNYGYFRSQFDRMLGQIDTLKPDVVLFIDYPGFNLRLAAALRKRGCAAKLIYYISPQVWAWNRGRIPRMAKILDLMLCIFPFEKQIYEASGLRTEFVGHPLIDSLEKQRTGEPRDPALIGLLPGSRAREVRKIFPLMLAAARRLHAQDPSLKFEASAARPELADLMQSEFGAHENLPVRIVVGEARELMQRASAGMMASGTATLEATFFQLPFILVYRVSWLTYIPARLLIRLKHIGITNILARREVVPEFIQHQATPGKLASAVRRLLDDEPHRTQMLAGFAEVIAELKGGRAAENVADHVLPRV